MKKATKRLKSIVEKEKTTLINLRVTEKELSEFKEKADIYTGGNISELIRYSVQNLKIDETDLIED